MKRLLMLVILASGLMLAAPVLAQGDGYPCFNLAAEDCAIIVTAGQNAAQMTSFAFLYDLEFSATGLLPLALFIDLPEEIRFASAGEGRFVIADDTPADLQLSLSANGALEDEPALAAQLELTIVDGVAYLRDVAGDSATMGFVLDAESLRSLLDALGITLDLPLEAVLEGNPANFGEFIQLDQLGGALNPSGADIAPFSDFVRGDDLLLATDNTLQEFVYTLDINALLASPEFGQLLALASGQAADDPTLGFLLQLLPVLLREVDATLFILQYVDADTGQLSAVTLDFALLFDINAALSPGRAGDPVDVRLLFTLTLYDVNTAAVVIPPPDAQIFSVADVLALLNPILP